MMDHEEIKALLPLAALDQLDPEEADGLDGHLRAGCDECEAELRDFREVAAALVLGLDPAGSQQRIWELLHARLASGVGAASIRPALTGIDGAKRGARVRVGIWRAATAAFAAPAVAAAIYAGVVSGQLHRANAERRQLANALNSQINNLRSELTSARGQVDTLQRVLADRVRIEQVLMAPDLRLTRLEPLQPARGARAIVVISTANRAAMIQVSGLPPTPPGKTYELWWITKEHGPIEAGLFQVGAGRSVVAPAALPPAGEHVLLSAVTLEPAGGVSKPTGAMYLKGAAG